MMARSVGETIVRVGPAAEASGEIERSDVRPRSTIATAAAHRHALGGPVAGPMVPGQFGGRYLDFASTGQDSGTSRPPIRARWDVSSTPRLTPIHDLRQHHPDSAGPASP